MHKEQMIDDFVKDARRPIVIPEVPTRFNRDVDQNKVRLALQRFSYATFREGRMRSVQKRYKNKNKATTYDYKVDAETEVMGDFAMKKKLAM